jgi:NitT/TauT family transport system substrate-binding protein
MKKKIVIRIIVAIALVGAAGYFLGEDTISPTGDIEFEKVTVQAGWVLNGQFANVCSAIVNGYYEKEGLDVELLAGGPTGATFIDATNAVALNNRITLGIGSDVVPLLRGRTMEDENQQFRVKAFGAFWNENPYGFIVRKDSGLTSLKDFANVKEDGTKYKIGVTADSVIQYAIAEYIGVPVEDIEIVIVGFDIAPFVDGQVDALAGYWTTQVYGVEQLGIEYEFLSAGELPGFSHPSSVLLASEKTLAEKPEILAKWLRATIKGSEFINENPMEAAEQIRDKRCGGPLFVAQQEAWLIERAAPLFDTEKIGWVYKDQIMSFTNVYHDLGQIPRVPTDDEILDYSILEMVYGTTE